MDQMADLSIIGSYPIVTKATWLGKLQLEVGFQQHCDGILRNNIMTDVTSFL